MTYVMFTFLIAAFMYWFGETSIMGTMTSNVQNTSGTSCGGSYRGVDLSTGGAIDYITNKFTNAAPSSCYRVFDTIATVITVVIVSSVGGALLGFGITYVIPIVMLFAFLNFLVFPIGSLFDPQSAIPDSIKLLVLAFFNIMTILTLLSYSNKGGV